MSAANNVLVLEVRRTLDQLVELMDQVDPKKVRSVRLGGELRGLLGKAQDECAVYEPAFLEFARHAGVSIALQNFAASLAQLFPVLAKLHSATFWLNRTFKKDVMFAFQEINSYYTSLFMELSMAVATHAAPPSPPVGNDRLDAEDPQGERSV